MEGGSPHERLFRDDSGRIVGALTRIFGLENLALAEDVMQDTFCRALEVWRLRGVPENPSAWLMKAAKNRAIDLLRRERTARNLAPQLVTPAIEDAFSVEIIKDDQLRMIFSCCDPLLSEQAQVALTLNLMCGFSPREIANSLLSTEGAVKKLVQRAKKVLSTSKHLFDLGDDELPERLSAVHRVLYLLFNEGYHGASTASAVRTELCREAMRLAALLLQNPRTSLPVTYALCALMWLHAARLPARIGDDGELVSLFKQDRRLWDRALIEKGNDFLCRAATGFEVSDYHVEAAIASLHSNSLRAEDTDWGSIVWLYDTLMKIRPSPVIALNRAIALAQRDGPEAGIAEIGAIKDSERLASYPFFPAALGEMELRAGQLDNAREHFKAAAALARNSTERRFLEHRLLATSA
jgi:RNA polymerase sigma factor (sigma-70 family)